LDMPSASISNKQVSPKLRSLDSWTSWCLRTKNALMDSQGSPTLGNNCTCLWHFSPKYDCNHPPKLHGQRADLSPAACYKLQHFHLEVHCRARRDVTAVF
jgi:hypothetical protein